MLAQRAAIVEHVAAHLRPLREHRGERIADGRAAGTSAARPAPSSRSQAVKCTWAMNGYAAERGSRSAVERRVGLAAVRAAGLRHVGPAAAALAAERLGALAHQIDGVEARGEIGA